MFFYFVSPSWGKISNLTDFFFQMGWFNHQADKNPFSLVNDVGDVARSVCAS